MSDAESLIQSDDDWKAEAQAEKERLAEQEAEAAAAGGGPGQMPDADFKTLISTMVTQALFAMGAIPDPQTGQRMVHVELAKHHIDMLGVIEEKTAGNLDDEETKMLGESLKELRENFVMLAEQVKAAQAQQTAGGADAGAGAAAGGIIDPTA